MSYHKATKSSLGLPRLGSAFTIIELLVVIAVIAALAAITVIAYVGITNQAHKVALSSGLSESVKALENYKTTNGITSSETYPTKLSDMTNLKLDNSINWTYYVPSTTDNTQNTSYCLQGTTNGVTQSVSSTDSSVQTKPCLENGLVGWWKLNGNANDSSGNNNNGTINGGVTTATGEDGVANHAYSFDGTSGYISIDYNSLFEVPRYGFTVAGWVNLSRADIPIESTLFGKGGDGGYDFRLQNYNGKFQLNLVKYWITDQRVLSSITVANGVWVHLTAVQSINSVSYYINGMSVGSFINSTSYIPLSRNEYIGVNRAEGAYLPGSIDDVRVYNRTLSSNEISALYSAGAQ